MEDIESKMKKLSDSIRKGRHQLGYSQEYVAFKVGLSQNAYSKIELGYTKLTLFRLLEIASILNIDASALLTEKK